MRVAKEATRKRTSQGDAARQANLHLGRLGYTFLACSRTRKKKRHTTQRKLSDDSSLCSEIEPIREYRTRSKMRPRRKLHAVIPITWHAHKYLREQLGSDI